MKTCKTELNSGLFALKNILMIWEPSSAIFSPSQALYQCQAETISPFSLPGFLLALNFPFAADHCRKRSDKMWRDGEADWWGRTGVHPECRHQLPDTVQKLFRGRLQNYSGELDPQATCLESLSLIPGLWPLNLDLIHNSDGCRGSTSIALMIILSHYFTKYWKILLKSVLYAHFSLESSVQTVRCVQTHTVIIENKPL